MTGAQILAAYTEIAKDDLFPVITITDSGVDATMAMFFINLGAERVMRLLRIEAMDTFNFTSGQPTYNYETCTGTRFYEVSKVLVNGSELDRASMGDKYGYYTTDESLVFNLDYPTNTVITLQGYKYAPAIANDSNEITAIHKSCHLAIAMLAIVESCVGHEDDPSELTRLQRMEAIAEDVCQKRQNTLAMGTFPQTLFNGVK